MRHQLDMNATAPTEHEPDDVFAWRRSQLVGSGFPQRLAGALPSTASTTSTALLSS
jgi:hypothetical protein